MSQTDKKIRVLIVDDSNIIRQLVAHMLSSDPDIEVVGFAPDPYVAREKLVELKPDVMTLDIQMPKMDGLTFLEKVMEHFPVPTIVISSYVKEKSETALRALAIGAVDIFAKPVLDKNTLLESIGLELIGKVKAAAGAKVSNIRSMNMNHPLNTNVKKVIPGNFSKTQKTILAIAASTGGTEALKHLLSNLPAEIPGTVIVQHMPKEFTARFADSLNSICPFEVKEAESNDIVHPGRVLLAPGNLHMILAKHGSQFCVRLKDGPLVHGVRPAADPLFSSVAQLVGKNAIGVVLTGMGYDGAQGLLEMKNAGSFNIAQDENTSIVFGMPKEAIAIGATHTVLPLQKISKCIMDECLYREKKLLAAVPI
ncbi:protein-glutamate methylesterase/protein-glutamine glutaminase [Fluviispira multicolorata]|uniref:Protein-glutamate methylesterase/protein-glutamine glutaminase n=1 Tax=Fluviispira multicolorata TaxID=2654512 RepID=A0A833JFM5_9BACT|nr:chemotaxis-specific protein-glutamate methyltransferase CheB [Fluviispira multicolorata]